MNSLVGYALAVEIGVMNNAGIEVEILVGLACIEEVGFMSNIDVEVDLLVDFLCVVVDAGEVTHSAHRDLLSLFSFTRKKDEIRNDSILDLKKY